MNARAVPIFLALLILAAPVPADAAWRRHYVADGRLSALRLAPDLASPILRRLRVARVVYEVGRSRDGEGRAWLRVAVTRRTRGWILAEALSRPGSGEERVRDLLDRLSGFDRMEVARLAADRFPRLREAANSALAEEAALAAEPLSDRANRRLGPLPGIPPDRVRALMLSDPGLDRFNRLGVFFDVDVESRTFVPRPFERR
jgi:hypothetical protein